MDFTKLKSKINKEMKEALVSLGSDPLASEVKGHIPTGWTLLDENMGGGLPLGRTVELFGEESTGKSSLLYQAAANCQEMGGAVVLFDPESTFPKDFASTLGVDINRILIMDSRIPLEKIFSHIIKVADLIRKEDADSPILIIWDTIAATPSKQEMDSMEKGEEFSRGANPFRAQIIKSGMRNCTNALAHTHACLVVVNHVYDSMQGGPSYGPPNKTPGGRGVKYHASVRINLWTGAYIKDGDTLLGCKVTAKVEKNKLGTPKAKVYSYFYYGVGFNDREAMMEYMLEHEIITRNGSWYVLHNAEGEEIKFLGANKFPEVLAANEGLYESLLDKAREHYRSSYVVSAAS